MRKLPVKNCKEAFIIVPAKDIRVWSRKERKNWVRILVFNLPIRAPVGGKAEWSIKRHHLELLVIKWNLQVNEHKANRAGYSVQSPENCILFWSFWCLGIFCITSAVLGDSQSYRLPELFPVMLWEPCDARILLD